jgi:hypothetical protein
MKIKLILLTALTLFLSNAEIKAQCPDSNAKLYLDKVQAAKNWTPTERVNSGNKVQRWTQISAWYAYNCECNQSTYTVKGVTKTRTANQAEAIRNNMNAISRTIQSNYPNAEFKPVIRNTPCGSGTQGGASGISGGQINNKTATQIEMENRFRNYNNAMNLKEQGENIAKAYAQQVKSYSELNRANSPEALLQNFNNNMQAIADLQTQNKADNLNQLTNTLNSTINDLNSGNHEGAMFSALSLLDQGEAKREARRKAEAYKQQLVIEAATQMSNFYWKAIELNNNAIDQYYQKAAYAFTKEEEEYLLKFIEHHNCIKVSMTNNFSYSSTSWTNNNCTSPTQVIGMSNNFIAKDIQYIQTAKRKYQLYLETNREVFQQGAMRFAGLAATTNPKIEYYYLMGHFAGKNNPLAAHSSFLTVQSMSPSYFDGDKSSEFEMIRLSLEKQFKKAIEENNREVIKSIIGGGLQNAVSIDGNSPIIYAITIDQPDVVQAFLNTDLKNKTETAITKKIRDVIMLASILDATNTIQRFSEMGYGVDFKVNDKSPLDIEIETKAIKSIYYLLETSDRKEDYLTRLRNQYSDIIKLEKIVNQGDLNLYKSLQSIDSKKKAIKYLYFDNDKLNFFKLLRNNENAVFLTKKTISKHQFRNDFYLTALFRIEERLDEDKERNSIYLAPFSEYVKYDLIGLIDFSIKHEDLQQIRDLIEDEGYAYSLYELEFQKRIKSGEEVYGNGKVQMSTINAFRKFEEWTRSNKDLTDEQLNDKFKSEVMPGYLAYQESINDFDEYVQNAKKSVLNDWRHDEKFIRNTVIISDEDINAHYLNYWIEKHNSRHTLSDSKGLNLLSASINRANSNTSSLNQFEPFEAKEHLKIATNLLQEFTLPKDSTFTLNFNYIVNKYSTSPSKLAFVNLAIEKKIQFDELEFYKLVDEIRYIETLNQYNIVKNNIELVIKNKLTDLSIKTNISRDYSFKNRKSKEIQVAFKQDKKYWRAVFEGNYNERH